MSIPLAGPSFGVKPTQREDGTFNGFALWGYVGGFRRWKTGEIISYRELRRAGGVG